MYSKIARQFAREIVRRPWEIDFELQARGCAIDFETSAPKHTFFNNWFETERQQLQLPTFYCFGAEYYDVYNDTVCFKYIRPWANLIYEMKKPHLNIEFFCEVGSWKSPRKFYFFKYLPYWRCLYISNLQIMLFFS